MPRSPLLLRLSIALLLAGGVSTGWAAAPRATDPVAGTLCTADESVLFSCKTARAKVASLCLAANPGTDASRLSYRFGMPGHTPELAYPPRGQRGAFTRADYAYARGHGLQIAFRVGDFRYTAYSDDHALGDSGSGVLVHRRDRQIAHLPCQGANAVALTLPAGLDLPEDSSPQWPDRNGPADNRPSRNTSTAPHH